MVTQIRIHHSTSYLPSKIAPVRITSRPRHHRFSAALGSAFHHGGLIKESMLDELGGSVESLTVYWMV